MRNSQWAWSGMGILIGWLLAACSPALDWREVRMDRLTVLLPCKPDRAQRLVRLGSTDVSMQMAGCKASDALFAVSHIRVADNGNSADTLTEWQAAILSNMRATNVQTRELRVGIGSGIPTSAPATNNTRSAGLAPEALQRKLVQGRGPDGQPISAQLAWFSNGHDIYHLAVYGKTLDAERTDMLFAEIRLR